MRIIEIIKGFCNSGQAREYQLCTMTYGFASVPYLALCVLCQLAADEKSRFPLAVTIIRTEIYIDDIDFPVPMHR